MNPVATQQVRSEVDFEATIIDFRRTIAQRCANILYGCHTNKRKLRVEIHSVLACIPFVDMRDQEDLKNEVYARLVTLLGNDCFVEAITITVILRTNYDRTQQEKYLRIETRVKRS